MIDYSIFYNSTIDISDINKSLPNFDIFISAYNLSERVKTIFSDIQANKKYWLIHPEYSFDAEQIPHSNICEVITPKSRNDKKQVEELIAKIGNINEKNICIDITGFMRHVLIYLVAYLKYKGINKFTAIYTEPIFYSKAGNTNFSYTSEVVQPISGITHAPNSEYTDHLIINIGYDHQMVSQVSTYKDGATIHPLFSFPSLSADMYQQSAMRASKSGSITQNPDWITQRRFSPANNPFATAQVISDMIRELDSKYNNKNNIYLSPISTKAQTLGFAIYWALEGKDRQVTMLLPECLSYSTETSIGLKRIWVYEVELALTNSSEIY